MSKHKQWAQYVLSLALVFAMLFQMPGLAFASDVADRLEEAIAAIEAELLDDETTATEETEAAELSDEVEAEAESGELPEATDDVDEGEELDKVLGIEEDDVFGLIWVDEDDNSDISNKTAPPPETENEAGLAVAELESSETGEAEIDENAVLEPDEEEIPPGVWSDEYPYFTDEVQPEIDWNSPRKFLASPFAMFGMPSTFAEAVYPTYEEAYNKMMALKSELPEGMTWTNYEPYGSKGNLGANYYFRGGAIKGARYGRGCAAFCFYLQDQVYGNLPIRVIDYNDLTYDDFHVGDFIRVINNRGGEHFVTITQITSSGAILAEGNYNGAVHWGRSMSKEQLLTETVFLVTRYPKHYAEEANRDEVAASGTEGALTWTLTEGGQLTISGAGTMPDYLNGDRPSWEDAGTAILSVDIGPGVKNIGANAFFQLKSLISVSLPDTIESIGNNAFNGSSVIGAAIPRSCRSVGNDAFSFCASLASIDIADGVETIGERAFRACSNLRYVDFPSSMKSVGAGAFFDCGEMTQVRFMPNRNIKIGDNLFTRCYNLNFVSLPEGITQLPAGLFQSCITIHYLYIPSTVKALDEVGKDGPFMNSSVGIIYFGGTQDAWNGLVKKVHPTLWSTITAISNATVIVNQKDPFVPDENPPDDMMTCENGHLGPIEDGVCRNCGKTVSGEELPVEPVDPPTGEHEHEWAEDWSHDTTHHWHECLVGGYFGCENDQKSGYAEHEFSEWATILEPTTEEDGVKERTCNVCDHHETEVVPKLPTTDPVDPPVDEHDHNWATTASYDSDYHWFDCLGDDCPITSNSEKDGYGQHSYADWVIDQAATTAQAGSKHRNCTGCAYQQIESIPKLPTPVIPPVVQHKHNWSSRLSFDVSYHWSDCLASGCTVSSNNQKSGFGVHSYADWVIDKEATADEAGRRHRDCTGCDYSQIEEIPATGSTDPGDEPVNPPTTHEHKWSIVLNYDEENHWFECLNSDCPITENGEKNGFGKHNYFGWIIDKEATAEEAGSQHRTCEDCGYVQTEEIPATGTSEPSDPGDEPGDDPVDPTPGTHEHKWSTGLEHDDDYHWSECENDNCPVTSNSEKGNYGLHSYGSWTVDKVATTTQTGSRHRECSICHYVQNERIPVISGGSSTPSSSEGTTKPSNSSTSTKPSETTKPSGVSDADSSAKPGGTPPAATSNGNDRPTIIIPAATVNAAEQRGEPVKLSMEAVRVAKDVASASTITVQSEKGGIVKVEIPVTAPTMGAVAMIVNPDGSTSVVRTSVPTKNGMVASLASGSTVKVVDNSKVFTDVAVDAWYNDAVTFASARELFAGTSETDFSPAMPMTRAMLITVLARLAGAETAGGTTWYAKAAEWAVASGISDGSRLNDNITREQLVVMLWRYMNEPVAADALSDYTDTDQIAGYAREAMNWAVENGLVNGFGDGRLGPQRQATRAQVAEILKNLISNLMQ